MAIGDIQLTVIGNLTADPELRYTPSGAAMARFTLASTPRQYDKASGQWQDGTATFLRCTAWRQLAEHIAESLAKGHQVIAQGRLRQHNWQNDQGENRSMLQFEVDEIGPSLRFATASVTKSTGTRPANNGGTGGAGAGGSDPWSMPTGNSAGRGDEPPF